MKENMKENVAPGGNLLQNSTRKVSGKQTLEHAAKNADLEQEESRI